jgi:hypothetical protein
MSHDVQRPVVVKARVVGLRVATDELIRDVVLWAPDASRFAVARSVVAGMRGAIEEYETLREALEKL